MGLVIMLSSLVCRSSLYSSGSACTREALISASFLATLNRFSVMPISAMVVGSPIPFFVEHPQPPNP